MAVIRKAGWHDSMKRTWTLGAPPPARMARKGKDVVESAKKSLQKDCHTPRLVDKELCTWHKHPITPVRPYPVANAQQTMSNKGKTILAPTLLSARKRDSADLQPTPTMSLPRDRLWFECLAS